MADESHNFTTTRARLEDIVVQVRKKDTSLEKSLDLLEEGVRLANTCTELIDHADWTAGGVDTGEGVDADAAGGDNGDGADADAAVNTDTQTGAPADLAAPETAGQPEGLDHGGPSESDADDDPSDVER